ncbi:MAG: hypothetical protein NT015_19065 [Alphaproteobacteria bacterium]|nr:hypothetical protein [Alphaproteobacteria bacterium]
MNHPACSAEGVETHPAGPGQAVFLCVFHLIAGVVAALLAVGVLAFLSRPQ